MNLVVSNQSFFSTICNYQLQSAVLQWNGQYLDIARSIDRRGYIGNNDCGPPCNGLQSWLWSLWHFVYQRDWVYVDFDSDLAFLRHLHCLNIVFSRTAWGMCLCFGVLSLAMIPAFLLPPVQSEFCFVVNCFSSLTLLRILFIICRIIWMMLKTSITKCVIWSRKSTVYLLLSPELVLIIILTRLFQTYCLSLYGSSLWFLSCPAIKNLDIAFNKLLRRIWPLPNHSHTGIVHPVAHLDSLFNVFRRSNFLLLAASKCSSNLVQSIFQSATLSCYFSFCGYYSMFASRHLTVYFEQYDEQTI